MSSRTQKRRILRMFHGRFHGKLMWRSAEEQAWLDMAPVGREFGSSDYDRLVGQDLNDFNSTLASLIDECSCSMADSGVPFDAAGDKDAINVQIAMREFGHDVRRAVVAAVWRHHSKSMMAGWMSGAETVASAKISLFTYIARKPANA